MQNPENAGAAAAPRNNRNNRNNQRNQQVLEVDEEPDTAANNNQFNMQQMAGRLRNFLETMDHQFPAADPLNQENDNEELPDLDEFD